MKRTTSDTRRRMLAFAVVVALSVAGAFGYAALVAWRVQRAAEAMPTTATTKIDALPAAAGSAAARDGGHRPTLMFRSTALGESYGRVSTEFLDGQGGQRLVSRLDCDRVHFAAGRGICLESRRGALTTYHAHIFDANFQIKHSHPLAGPPSRARMSPDGQTAAVTVFVSGHSYSSPGFVTRTSLIDASSGGMLADDLEKFDVRRGDAVIKAADFNFWGVTFIGNGRRFYATLGTAGKTLLVEGDVSARKFRVLRDDVECPSVSPDGTKIAFKRRQSAGAQGRIFWGIHVLELATGKELALRAEARNVDDQVEWFGNAELLYAMPDDAATSSAATHVWVLSADGAGAPRLLVSQAFSPTVIR